MLGLGLDTNTSYSSYIGASQILVAVNICYKHNNLQAKCWNIIIMIGIMGWFNPFNLYSCVPVSLYSCIPVFLYSCIPDPQIASYPISIIRI